MQKFTATRRRNQVKTERRIERNEELLAVPYLTQASATCMLFQKILVDG